MRGAGKLIAGLAISQSELFAAWPAEARAQVLAAADVIRLENGACLHRPGDEAEYVYLIAAGSLRLSHQSASGRRFTAWLQVAGDFHGIGPVLSATPHLYIATAKGATELVRIPARRVRSLLAADGRLALAVLSVFYRRYRYALSLYETASTGGVRARLASLLKSLAARGPRARAPAVALSQSELASMLGTRRQVVNRELRALAAAGAVRLAYGRIAVVDGKVLDRFALGAG